MSDFFVVEEQRRFFYRQVSESSTSTVLINSPSGDLLMWINAESVKSFDEVSYIERNESKRESTSSAW